MRNSDFYGTVLCGHFLYDIVNAYCLNEVDQPVLILFYGLGISWLTFQQMQCFSLIGKKHTKGKKLKRQGSCKASVTGGGFRFSAPTGQRHVAGGAAKQTPGIE